jgi:hypothetical protein
MLYPRVKVSEIENGQHVFGSCAVPLCWLDRSLTLHVSSTQSDVSAAQVTTFEFPGAFYPKCVVLIPAQDSVRGLWCQAYHPFCYLPL